MSEMWFVIKTMLFSVLMLVVLQMRIGGATLEQHSESWIYKSKLGGELQTIAQGAIRAGHEGYSWIKFQASDKLNTDQSATEKNRERSSQSRSRYEEALD